MCLCGKDGCNGASSDCDCTAFLQDGYTEHGPDDYGRLGGLSIRCLVGKTDEEDFTAFTEELCPDTFKTKYCVWTTDYAGFIDCKFIKID